MKEHSVAVLRVQHGESIAAATVDQLRSNLAARRLVLSADDLDELGALREAPAAYWATRAALPKS